MSASEIAALAVQPASLQFLPVTCDAAGNIILSWTGNGTPEQASSETDTWGATQVRAILKRTLRQER